MQQWACYPHQSGRVALSMRPVSKSARGQEEPVSRLHFWRGRPEESALRRIAKIDLFSTSSISRALRHPDSSLRPLAGAICPKSLTLIGWLKFVVLWRKRHKRIRNSALFLAMAQETKLERIAREIADARRIVDEKRASVAWLRRGAAQPKRGKLCFPR